MKTRKIMIFGLLVVFFGFVILAPHISMASPIVLASDDDGDGVDDAYEDENKRRVEIEFDGTQVEIKSHLEGGNDEINIKVDHDTEGLQVEVEYESESDSNETEIEFHVTFRSLIEFVDVNVNGEYDDGETVIDEIVLDSFNTTEYTPIVQVDGSTLHYLKAKSTDDIFTAHIYVGEEFIDLNGTTITPTEVKIDIEINYTSYGDPSSQLALYTHLESEAEYTEEEDTDDEVEGYAEQEEGVKVTINDHIGFFTWAKTAKVDGVDQPVVTTALENDSDGDEKMYIIYPRGNHIYHDPKIGLALAGEGFPWLMTLGIIAGVSIGVIAVVALIYKRKKRV